METKTYQIKNIKLAGDRFTPVNLYLKIRDAFPYSILLESSDYRANDNAFSFIAFDRISNIKAEKKKITITNHIGEENTDLKNSKEALEALKAFKERFKISNPEEASINGLFGLFFHPAIEIFEDSDSDFNKEYYNFTFYRYILIFNHFTNQLTLQYYLNENETPNVDHVLGIINSFDKHTFPFKKKNEESSDFKNEEYLQAVAVAKEYLQKGDIFQVVLSRKFNTSFKGDEFNVYRALRIINPSPYLFYFDLGDYKVFGSSPEAQLKIKNNSASIFPIAGTYKRTGNDLIDQEEIKKLLNDEKENAEHSMLVDLARNDLSKYCTNVSVVKYKEIQIFSHVIHLVSEVNAQLKPNTNSLDVLAGSFPAGTLSGAPKIRALEIINELERSNRNFYGACVGYLGFNNDINMAITIRSFKSEKNTLEYRAGAGIVIKSIPENELNEINNKIAALRKAIEYAETI